MKYWKRIITVFACVVILSVSCFFIFRRTVDDRYIYAKNLSTTKEVGDVFYVADEYEITAYTNGKNTKPIFISGNTNLLEINPITGQGVCVQAGETKIIIRLNTDGDIIEKEVSIIISEKIVEPTYLSMANNKVILTNTFVSRTNPFLTDAQNCVMEVSYQNGFVEYNLETKVVSTKVEYGSDKVFIKIYKKDGSYLETSFDVSIKESNGISPIVEISKNEAKKITYDYHMFEFGENIGQPTIQNPEVVELVYSNYGYFYIKGLQIGQSEVCLTDGFNQLVFTVIVAE